MSLNIENYRRSKEREIERRWSEFFHRTELICHHAPGGFTINGTKFPAQFWLPKWYAVAEVRFGMRPFDKSHVDVSFGKELIARAPQYDYLIIYGTPAENSYDVTVLSMRYVEAMKRAHPASFAPYANDRMILESDGFRFGSITEYGVRCADWVLIHPEGKAWWAPDEDTYGESCRCGHCFVCRSVRFIEPADLYDCPPKKRRNNKLRRAE